MKFDSLFDQTKPRRAVSIDVAQISELPQHLGQRDASGYRPLSGRHHWRATVARSVGAEA